MYDSMCTPQVHGSNNLNCFVVSYTTHISRAVVLKVKLKYHLVNFKKHLTDAVDSEEDRH